MHPNKNICMKRILIIDDDVDMCTLLGNFLQRKGFEAVTCQTGNKGIEKFKESLFDVVLCDFRLGDTDGRKVLQEIKTLKPGVVFIFITGYSDLRMAVEVIRNGAFDYISKPLIPEEVINVINRGCAEAASSQEPGHVLQSMPEMVSKKQFLNESEEFFTGTAPQTIELYKQIDLVAPTNYSVIIYGESGTGKEVIAKTIHKKSNRRNKAFVALDCGTLSRELAASELFGHIKGSFTGALTDKEGIFEVADGGTLFLDEVANLSLDVQATLLRVIQGKKI
jgi:two-component system, NtrC family, response regulator HydG